MTRVATFLFITLELAMSTYAQSRPLVIAHRGASGYLPEHTLEAVAAAHAMRADYVEQDIVLTRDDVAVVLHDRYLEAVTNVKQIFPGRSRQDGHHHVMDFTLQEIKRLKVTERIDLKTGQAVYPNRFPLFQADFRVPTLAEQIELIQGLGHSTGRAAGLFVEIKSPRAHRAGGKDIGRAVLQTLARFGYDGPDDKAIVQCFDPAETRRLREQLGSRLRLVQLIGNSSGDEGIDYDAMRTAAGLRQIAEYADGIAPALEHILKPSESGDSAAATELVQMAHELGLKVYPYTLRADALPDYVETFEELVRRFRGTGVDGVITDFPDRTLTALH
jgi:glycerophosphoryl diester phosphodiesterase